MRRWDRPEILQVYPLVAVHGIAANRFSSNEEPKSTAPRCKEAKRLLLSAFILERDADP
jgi:hypothetical protein